MKVVNVAGVAGRITPGADLRVLLDGANAGVKHGIMGWVRIEPGARLPAAEGTFSVHDCEEFSYVISGRVRCWVEGQEVVTGPGDAMIIHPGERHWCVNEGDEPCDVVWVLAPPIQL